LDKEIPMRRSSLAVFATAAFAAALLGYACGGSGSGSGSSYVDKCKQVCEKEKTCFPEYSAILGDCGTFCASNAGSGGSSGSDTSDCKNPDAAIAKADQCLAMQCSALQACFQQIDTICGGDSATGGTSGGTTGGTSGGSTGGISGGSTGGSVGATGGTSGGGGASGAADCNTACGKAYTCCAAVLPTLGQDASLCDAIKPATVCANAATAGTYATSCQSQLESYSVLNNPACK